VEPERKQGDDDSRQLLYEFSEHSTLGGGPGNGAGRGMRSSHGGGQGKPSAWMRRRGLGVGGAKLSGTQKESNSEQRMIRMTVGGQSSACASSISLRIQNFTSVVAAEYVYVPWMGESRTKVLNERGADGEWTASADLKPAVTLANRRAEAYGARV